MNEEYDLEEGGYDGPSKSQIKRDMLALQALGERLMGLRPELWGQFPLGPRLLESLEESRRIRSHSALRRHVRRLGKLISEENPEAIREVLERLDSAHQGETRRLHLLERWRDRLIAEGDDALAELATEYPQVDRQQVRQLVRDARKEADHAKPPAAARKLFRLLREIIE
jgi:ribosome-associated protein